jgi:hypothetical protein
MTLADTLRASPPLMARESPPEIARQSPPLMARSPPLMTLADTLRASPPLMARESPPEIARQSPPLMARSPPLMTLAESVVLPVAAATDRTDQCALRKRLSDSDRSVSPCSWANVHGHEARSSNWHHFFAEPCYVGPRNRIPDFCCGDLSMK